jgi:ABC-2 type transport system permease protein
VIAWQIFRQGLVVGREDFRAFWNWRTWFSAWMVRIGTSAALWVLLGRMLGSERQAQYLLIGNAVMAGPIAIGMVIPASAWDRWEGTYPLIVISPSSIVPAHLGRTIIWLLHGVGTSLATFALLATAFGLTLNLHVLLWLPWLIGAVCASAYCFLLALGALVNRAPPFRNVLQNGTMPLLMAVCGVSVPLEFWCEGVQTLAQALPITHGLLAIRTLFEGGAASNVLRDVARELLVGAGWFVVASLAIDRLANAGRADGSIELA